MRNRLAVAVIDLHCHILWGIDDGPQTPDESLALARAAVAAGTKLIVATPHVSWSHRNDSATVAARVRELNERLRAERIDLEVRPGAEIAATLLPDMDQRELRRLALGGAGGRWLLIELPFTQVVTGLDALIYALARDGYGIVLAHPERCGAFHRDRSMFDALIGSGVLSSITAGSLVGRFGKPVQRLAEQMLRDELVHNVASDAHDALARPPSVLPELEQAGVTELADWLTRAVPSAILDNREPPPRPFVIAAAPQPERRLARWLSGRD
jgi:protein-tyrosine phosphatase